MFISNISCIIKVRSLVSRLISLSIFLDLGNQMSLVEHALELVFDVRFGVLKFRHNKLMNITLHVIHLKFE